MIAAIEDARAIACNDRNLSKNIFKALQNSGKQGILCLHTTGSRGKNQVDKGTENRNTAMNFQARKSRKNHAQED
jgi:hypothetical protein